MTHMERPIRFSMWVMLVVPSLSIAGFPLVAGFGAKALTLTSIPPWQSVGLTIAAIGTAIAFAKFIFLPFQTNAELDKPLSPGLWAAVTLLLSGLIAANGFLLETYTVSNLLKAVMIIAVGWLIYGVLIRPLKLELPRAAEQFEHLIGAMSLVLVLLFSMVLV